VRNFWLHFHLQIHFVPGLPYSTVFIQQLAQNVEKSALTRHLVTLYYGFIWFPRFSTTAHPLVKLVVS